MLSITDANLFLGRILPEHFPSIFGPEHNMPLDYEATKHAFLALTTEINAFLQSSQSGCNSTSLCNLQFCRL